MGNELMVREERKPLTAAEMVDQVRLIQEVMNAVMVKDVHYGVIPGTPKPTLYKAGAEKLLSTFNIGVDPREEITDLSSNDEIRYRVLVKGFSRVDGDLFGVGLGECSSNEEKYKWRKPVCDEEFDETPTDRKRIAWKRGDKGPYQQKQVRMNPIDVANTILKMAKKRGLIDMTLTVTAASDIFDQDIEDLPDGMELGANGKSPLREPKKKGPEQKKEESPKTDTQKITTQILNVTQKDGKKPDGKTPYTIYTITGQVEEGQKGFHTFDKKIMEIALKAKGTSQLFEIEYRISKFGNDIVNMTEPSDENVQT